MTGASGTAAAVGGAPGEAVGHRPLRPRRLTGLLRDQLGRLAARHRMGAGHAGQSRGQPGQRPGHRGRDGGVPVVRPVRDGGPRARRAVLDRRRLPVRSLPHQLVRTTAAHHHDLRDRPDSGRGPRHRAGRYRGADPGGRGPAGRCRLARRRGRPAVHGHPGRAGHRRRVPAPDRGSSQRRRVDAGRARRRAVDQHRGVPRAPGERRPGRPARRPRPAAAAHAGAPASGSPSRRDAGMAPVPARTREREST